MCLCDSAQTSKIECHIIKHRASYVVHVDRMPMVGVVYHYIVVACNVNDSYRHIEYVGDLGSRRVMADMLEDLPA